MGQQPSAAPPATDADLVKTLLQRIDQLEKRVSELESKQAPEAPAPGAPAAGGGAVASPEEVAHAGHVHDQIEVATNPNERTYPDLHIRGFADMTFGAQNVNNSRGARSGFGTGQFILHFASALSPKISYFGEISMTFISNGVLMNLERSIIRYDTNDWLKTSFGQYHVPTSYYNMTYHHGYWLQTSIARPAMVDFATGPLPQHILGAAVEGNIPSGSANLGYMAGIGNGSGGFSIGDSDNNRAWFATLYTRPAAINGLRIGGSIYQDKRKSFINNQQYRETIGNLNLIFSREPFEFLGEIALIRHRQVGQTPTFNSTMGYVQMAYRLPWNDRKWKPYYLFDYINTPKLDPIFGNRDLVGHTMGMRWDISDFAAFKLEYRNQKRRMIDHRVEAVVAQTTFTF